MLTGCLLFEQILYKFVERLAPYLPFVIARVGVESYVDTLVAHLFHNVAGLFDAWILLTASHEEYVEVLVECMRIRQNAWYFLL